MNLYGFPPDPATEAGARGALVWTKILGQVSRDTVTVPKESARYAADCHAAEVEILKNDRRISKDRYIELDLLCQIAYNTAEPYPQSVVERAAALRYKLRREMDERFFRQRSKQADSPRRFRG